MSSIREGAETFISKCASCKHPKVSHQRPTFRDEQRSNPKTIQAFDYECKDCKKEGKICESFKDKN